MKKGMSWMLVAGMSLALTAAAAGGPDDSAKPEQSFFAGRESYMRADLQNIEKRYMECLTCGNNGVVESALAHIALVKMYRPDAEIPALQARVRSLAVAGCTPVIRYKAQLVSLLFDYPSVFAGARVPGYSSSEEMFASLAQRMRETLLTDGDWSRGTGR